MKKFLLIAVSALGFFTQNAKAQSFLTEADTVITSFTSGGSDVTSQNKISSTGSSQTSITWKVVSTNFPSSWTVVCGGSTTCSVGICDNHNCYNNIATSQIFGSNPASHTSDPYPISTNPSTGGGDFHLLLNATLPSIPSGQYYVTINLQAGSIGQSKNITFIVNVTSSTGVGNVPKNLNDVELYPNPAHGTLNLSYDPNAGIRNISVYNLIGKSISSYRVNGNGGNTSIDINDIPSGVYFVRLLDAQNRVLATRKFTHQ